MTNTTSVPSPPEYAAKSRTTRNSVVSGSDQKLRHETLKLVGTNDVLEPFVGAAAGSKLHLVGVLQADSFLISSIDVLVPTPGAGEEDATPGAASSVSPRSGSRRLRSKVRTTLPEHPASGVFNSERQGIR